MKILTRVVTGLMLVSLVTFAACASNENADEQNSDASDNGVEMVAPTIGAPTEARGEEAKEQILAPNQSFDEKGNVVDMDGNIVMDAEQAKKNNMKEQPHEKATKEELVLIQKIISANGKFIATAHLGSNMATSNELIDIATQFENERRIFNDMSRSFLDITHSKVTIDESPKPEKINATKGKAWDKTWGNKLLDMNINTLKMFDNTQAKHHEILNLMQQMTDHINSENELLREVLNRPAEG